MVDVFLWEIIVLVLFAAPVEKECEEESKEEENGSDGASYDGAHVVFRSIG